MPEPDAREGEGCQLMSLAAEELDAIDEGRANDPLYWPERLAAHRPPDAALEAAHEVGLKARALVLYAWMRSLPAPVTLTAADVARALPWLPQAAVVGRLQNLGRHHLIEWRRIDGYKPTRYAVTIVDPADIERRREEAWRLEDDRWRRKREEDEAFRKSPESSAIVQKMVDDAYGRGVKDGAASARAEFERLAKSRSPGKTRRPGTSDTPDPDAELARAKSELATAHKLIKEMAASLSWAQARHRSPEAAMLAEIEAAHRELVKKHHPDRGGDPGIMTGLNLMYEKVEAAIARVR